MLQETNEKKVNGHLLQLDGLKGVICFFIIFVHYYNRTPNYAFPISWLPMFLVAKGWMFVEFFFIISGFLFAGSYKNKIPFLSLGTYLHARLKRLYPSAVLIAVFDGLTRLVDIGINGGGTRLTVEGFLRTLFFTETWIYNGEPFPTVVWYIHVLFLCYVVYYFIAKAKNPEAYLVSMVGMLLFGWMLYTKQWDIPFLYRNIGRGYMAFAVGGLLREFQNRASEKLRVRVTCCAAFFAAAVLLAGAIWDFGKVFGDILLVCTLLLFPAAMLCLLNWRWVGKIFSCQPLVWLGKLSMATFLVHVPVMNLVQALCYQSGALPFDRASTFSVVLPTIFVVAVLWHYGIEKKLIPAMLTRLENGK